AALAAGGRARHGRAVRGARRGGNGARAGAAGAADRGQQPQPAQLRDRAGNFAGAAGADRVRPHPGRRVGHPHAGRRGAPARGRHPGVPGRRGVHARRRSGQRAAASVRYRVRPMPETMEAALADEHAGRRVVLFDFDGVLMHGDAFYLFVRERYARSLWRKGLALLCAPLLLLLLPLSRRWPLHVLVRIALLGVGERRYQAVADSFAVMLARRPRQFCRDGLRSLRQHQALGDRVIVVTGLEVLASQLRAGWSGMRPVWHNVGRRKVQSLARHGVTAWQVAYGDSMYDVAMLKPADEAVLVNGTPKLCKKVEKALGRTIRRVDWS